MCRFYLLLAGAVGKRQGIAIPYPSPTPLLTPFGDPLRRGILAAAVDRDFGFRYPVLLLLPSSEYCLAICVRAGIVRVSGGLLVLDRSSFIIGGRSFVPAATVGLAMVFRRICADRAISTISYRASPFHQLCWVEEYRKKRVRAAETS